MKSFRIAALASAALSGLAVLAPLQAADIYAPPPPAPVAPVMNWTGFYIGAGGGGNFLFADSYTAVDFFGGKPQLTSDHDFFADAELSADLSDVGGFGTVQGGFDWQFGDRFVAGVFGNYDFGKTRASHSWSAAPYCDGFCEGLRARVTLEDSWAVGGRLGFLSSESTLWYGLVGYTQAKIKGEAGHEGGGLRLASDHGDYQYSWSDWQDGLVVGGGVETLLTDAISLKMEYRYTDYESFGGKDGIEDIYYGTEQVAEFDPEVHSIRGVVSWRFGNLF